MSGESVTEFAARLRAIPLRQFAEAEQLFLLRRQLPLHVDDVSDLVAIARGFGWTLAQLGAFLVYLHHRHGGE